MTEFEKWKRKEFGVKFTTSVEIALEVAWTDALKWAYNELRNNANGFFNIGKELESLAQSNNQSNNKPTNNAD